MRVKLLKTIEERDGERPVRYPKGTHVDFPDARAEELIADGSAEHEPGPELQVTCQESPKSVVIAYEAANDLALEIDGARQEAIDPSPITVTRTSKQRRYVFSALLHGARVEKEICVPALEKPAAGGEENNEGDRPSEDGDGSSGDSSGAVADATKAPAAPSADSAKSADPAAASGESLEKRSAVASRRPRSE